MSQKGLKRLHVIQKVLERELKQEEAGRLLGLSDRQVRRHFKRVRSEGDSGIIHRSRGRKSNRAYPDYFRDKVLVLYRESYHDFGPTLANEKLFEREKIDIDIATQTLRNWLIEGGLWHVSRKRDTHRNWRERRHYFGEMIQLDGSHHDWFEGRGARCVMMGYIDDATNTAYGRFYEYEGTVPAMEF